MASLAELKASSPAYAGMSDEDFAQRVYQKHYAGRMSFDDFSQRVGAKPKADFSGVSSRVTADGAGVRRAGEVRGVGGTGRPYTGPLLSGAGAGASKSDAEIARLQAEAEKGVKRRTQAEAKRDAFRELPTPLRGLIGAGSRVGDLAMGAGQLLGVTDEADAAAQREQNAYMDGDFAAGAGGVAADVALLWNPVARLARAPRAAQYAGNVALGAGMGALAPTVEGESRAANTAIGGALGAVGQGASEAVMAAGKRAAQAVAPEVRQLAQRASDLGIRLTPAQVSNSAPLKSLRSTLGRLPFSGAQKVGQQQDEQFNRALSRTFGEDAPAVNQAVYARGKERIGGDFNALTQRNAMAVDDTVLGELVAIQQEAGQFGADDTARAVNSAIERALSQTDNGVLSGRVYQSLDSELGRITKGGGEKAHYVGRVRETLRNAMDRSISPADQEAWQQARQQYRNLKTIRDLVAKETTDGISPGLLMGRLNANNAGKEAMASGRGGELADLARIGSRFLRDPIPNSGTAERLGWLGALGGGGAMLGVEPATLGLGLGGGRLARMILDDPRLARYLLSEGRGQTRQMIAPYLRPAGVAAAPLVTPETERP